MTDPLGLIGSTGPVRPTAPTGPGGAPLAPPTEGPGFRELLEGELARVNEIQQDAKEAVEDWAVGRRDDVESVILAAKKADIAFKMLLQVRNKVMNAYEEVKQIRV